MRGRWTAPEAATAPPTARHTLGVLCAHVLLVDKRVHVAPLWDLKSRSAREARLPMGVSVGPRSRAFRLPATQSYV